MAADLTLSGVLQLAARHGLAHNNGAGGEILLCASEAQLLAFAGALATPVAPTLFELNEHTEAILGRPNFTCIHLAQALRMSGRAIKNHAEEEQAAVIHYLLGFYMSHGAGWLAAAAADLKRLEAEWQKAKV